LKIERDVIDFERIARGTLCADPYRWAEIDRLFAPPDDEALAATFPLDHYKLVAGADGEKSCTYEVRPFIHMGPMGSRIPRT